MVLNDSFPAHEAVLIPCWRIIVDDTSLQTDGNSLHNITSSYCPEETSKSFFWCFYLLPLVLSPQSPCRQLTPWAPHKLLHHRIADDIPQPGRGG